MSIQANINSMLSLAGLLASQSPAAESRRADKAYTKQKEIEERVELARQEAEKKRINKEIETYEKMAEQGETPTDEATRAAQLEIAKTGREAYLAKFKMKPTPTNYKKYAAIEGDIAELSKPLEPEEKATEAAEKALRKEQDRLQRDRIRAQITEGIYLTGPEFDPRKKEAEK